MPEAPVKYLTPAPMATPAPPQGVIGTIKTYGSFVKFSHTVFALPFAITGFVVALATNTARGQRIDNWNAPHPPMWLWPSHVNTSDKGEWLYQAPHALLEWKVVILVLTAMIGARTFAMAANRIFDWKIDSLNPRTTNRELPSGKLTMTQAWLFLTFAAGMYFGACGLLGPVTLALSPIPIVLMAYYPFTKRFTSLCHFVLGASLGLAPIGAWVAVRAGGYPRELEAIPVGWGAVGEALPWILGLAVMLWVAGFDIIYALQDVEFDNKHELYSVPAKFGRTRGLSLARITHLFCAGVFFLFGAATTGHLPEGFLPQYAYTPKMPIWVLAAPTIALVGIIWQHRLVKPNDLSRVNMAFFTVNGIISVLFGAVYVAGYVVWRLSTPA